MGARSILVGVLVCCLLSALPIVSARESGPFSRGDTNGSGKVDISDVIFLLQFLFRGGETPVCAAVSDMNSDGSTDIGDPIYGLGVFFRGVGELAPLSVQESAECDVESEVVCGQRIFRTPDPLGNAFACSTCHGTESAREIAAQGPLLPAHGLGDVVARPSWIRGEILSLESAIDRCRADWMGAPSLGAESDSMRQIVAYLDSLWNGGESPALEFDIVTPTVAGPSDGDPVAGCELFGRGCAGCHGELGSGSELAPGLFDREISADDIREHVRLSGPSTETVPSTLYEGLLGNRMPFWSRQRLSDSQLEDIVAYLDVAENPARRTCDQVDVRPPELIRTGTFRTIGHGVRGRVEQWSDRRIRLVDFHYDGEGPPDVLAWVYQKDPSDSHAILHGRPISEHLARGRPYVDVDLEFEIPEEIDPDSFNAVAIWCTAFQTTYGDADLSP